MSLIVRGVFLIVCFAIGWFGMELMLHVSKVRRSVKARKAKARQKAAS